MGRGLCDNYVVQCKVSLVGTCIKRREVVNGIRRIRSKKLRGHRYGEGYARCLENKKAEMLSKKTSNGLRGREVCARMMW